MNKETTVQDQVIQIIGALLDTQISQEKIQVELTTEFSQLGLNSVDFTKFLIALEKEFGFEFDDEKLLMKNHKNLAELIAYVKTKIDSTTPI